MDVGLLWMHGAGFGSFVGSQGLIFGFLFVSLDLLYDSSCFLRPDFDILGLVWVDFVAYLVLD